MFENIENLKLLNVVEGVSIKQGMYTNRVSHAFVYKCTGASVYHFGGRTLELRAGEVLFIPKGSSYTVRRTSDEESNYVLINFDGVFFETVPGVYSLEGFLEEGLLQTGLARLWLFGAAAERYRCISVFYSLLSFLAKKEVVRQEQTGGLDLIRPAVDFLRGHLFDCELRVGELHRLCRVSDTYFRRVFKANFGVTPQEYVTNKRLAQAAALINGGDFHSIRQVALSVGYSDPLYFSRVFVRQYGSCPSKYLRK